MVGRLLQLQPHHPWIHAVAAAIAETKGDAAAADRHGKLFRQALAGAAIKEWFSFLYDSKFEGASLAEAFPTVPREGDISDHLGTLYFQAVSASPRLIVELGTRGGESTKALLAAARDVGAQVLSLDIDNCSNAGIADSLKALWTFVHHDDVSFGQDKFPAWCTERGLEPQIDVLFIDTSHLYEHTKQEIAVWFPHLRPGATVIFHDTNITAVSGRNDGTLFGCWNNERGVIRAIEEYLGVTLDEKTGFAGNAKGWFFQHWPNCAGLMVLRAPRQ